jgi:S-layer homology domain
MAENGEVRPRRATLSWRRVLLTGGLVATLAVAVPIAWASFGDVPPSNPCYDDINAIQGAGITGGCGGGNFCPSDNILRMAEAAFVHRGLPRGGLGGATSVLPASPTVVELGHVTMSIGGVSGQTQFVLVIGQVDTQISSLTGCPCETSFVVSSDQAGDFSFSGAIMNDSLPAAGGPETNGLETATAAGIVAVPTATNQTFRIFASRVGGTGTVTAFGTLSAVTIPFGSTGANTLGLQASTLAHRKGIRRPLPPK